MKKIDFLTVLLSLLLMVVASGWTLGQVPPDEMLAAINEAIHSGVIAHRLTEPGEIIERFGAPQKTEDKTDGGMVIHYLYYPQTVFEFGRFKNFESPFTLRAIRHREQEIDIGQDRKLTLRHSGDISKIDPFNGLQEVSLVKVDLREQADGLEKLSFDTRTEWPAPDRLPAGFDPVRLLSDGRKPYMGIARLHRDGIDGQGVGIAVLDQPLLREHQEYQDRLSSYEEIDVAGVSPQMHGTPIVALVGGNTLGVAPKVSIHYYAIPMWKKSNAHYVEAIRRVIQRNLESPQSRIRVVTISTGMFDSYDEYPRFQEMLRKAEDQGILVLTCAKSDFTIGTLQRIPLREPENSGSYCAGAYSMDEDAIRAPVGGITMASHRGSDVYRYEVNGGRSWATPFVAAVAALGFQVDPALSPASVKRLLVDSALKTSAGPMINPVGFIECVKKQRRRESGR